MEQRLIPADLLLKQCKNPLKSQNKEELFSYSSYAARTILNNEIKAYDSLKLSIYDGVFAGGKSVSDITRKKYGGQSEEMLQRLMSCEFLYRLCRGAVCFVYPVDIDNNCLLKSPVRITAKFDGDIKELSHYKKILKFMAQTRYSFNITKNTVLKKQGEVELKIGGAVMKESYKNQAFVSRFNEETFFKDFDLTGLMKDRLLIEDKSDKLHFAQLYAISFFGLSFDEIFAVDRVFGFSDMGIRNRDSVKKSAALALRDDLRRLSDNNLASMLEMIGKALDLLPLPKITAESSAFTAKNYVNYISISDLGSVFLKASESSSACSVIYREKYADSYKKAKDRAKLLCEYKKVVNLCEDIAAISKNKGANIYTSLWFKEALQLQKDLRNMEDAKG